MKTHCNNCELLKKKVEILQEELMENKKAYAKGTCPECERRRKVIEGLHETLAEWGYKNKNGK